MSLFDGAPQLQPPYHVVDLPDNGNTLARNTYRDGGTLAVNVVLNTVPTQVFRDGRISSPTKRQWFDRYPGHEGATLLPWELADRLDMWLLGRV